MRITANQTELLLIHSHLPNPRNKTSIYNLYNNTLKSRDTCPANCVPRDTCLANCVSRDACQANCVVQTVADISSTRRRIVCHHRVWQVGGVTCKRSQTFRPLAGVSLAITEYGKSAVSRANGRRHFVHSPAYRLPSPSMASRRCHVQLFSTDGWRGRRGRRC